MKIAIIGAGLSGTNIYNLLKKENHDVTIFEKSRGAGGRCSTRYIKDKFIDHGTPFFKAQNNEFVDFCELKVKENLLVKKGDCYYPTKGINKICSFSIDQNDFIKNTKIIACSFKDKKWTLEDQSHIKYTNYDKLILTIPTPQILDMDIEFSKEVKKTLEEVEYDSIATLLIYSYTLQNIMNPKLLNSGDIEKIIDNSTKYNYENFSSYVIHLNNHLTNKQNFKNKEEVKEFIIKNIFDISGIDLEEDFHILPHLWRYGLVSKGIDKDYLYDDKYSLGFCGDYFRKKDLESAFLSSKRLYENEFRK